MPVTGRLPGITFVGGSLPPDDVLPRMDVAGFVGFAETGPVDQPVPIADPAGFAEVFGGPVALLRDADTGEPVVGQLADAVTAFFANGGQRCWVVRVAGRPPAAAVAAAFPVPGLAVQGSDGRPVQALFPARAVGSWADRFAVSSGLLATPVRLDQVNLGEATVRCRLLAGKVAAGDLVRLTYTGAELLFAVRGVAAGTVIGDSPLWMATAPTSGSATGTTIDGVPVSLDLRGPWLDLATTVDRAPAAGTLLRLDIDGTGPAVLLTSEVRAVAGSAGGARLSGPLFLLTGALAGDTSTPGAAHVLTLQLRVRTGTARPVVLSDLGFVRGHPRFVGDLPSDEAFYAQQPTIARPRPPLSTPLWTELAAPRFPLAGPHAPVLYPIGLSALPDVPYVGPLPTVGSRLARDGLAEFSPRLFLDPELIGVGEESLLATAEFLRDGRAVPQALRGIHALLGVDEVTLLAVPDAVQAPWQPVAPPAVLPQPPAPEAYSVPAECAHTGGVFRDREEHLVTPPVLGAPAVDALGTVRMSWTGTPGRYVLEESTTSLRWAGAREVYRGTDLATELYGRAPGAYFYRLRVETDTAASDWSAGVAAYVPGEETWRLTEPDRDALVLAHRAVVAACAARGDILAVLGVPRGFQPVDAVEHVAALRLPAGDDRTPSFAALYHPWLSGPDGRAAPPIGAATGLLAATAWRAGSWTAAANRAVAGAAGVDGGFGPAFYGMLEDASVNTVRQEPRGVLWLAQHTLSADPELGQVNVRRLLSLLRRVAAQYGPTFVFEPDNTVLHRHIRRRLEALLAGLLARGAFAGPTAATSFQVAVAGQQPAGGEGRLVVELRVAPSVPMRYLTVRLVAGDGALVVEGV